MKASAPEYVNETLKGKVKGNFAYLFYEPKDSSQGICVLTKGTYVNSDRRYYPQNSIANQWYRVKVTSGKYSGKQGFMRCESVVRR